MTAATGTNIVDVAGRAPVKTGGDGKAVLDDVSSGLRIVTVTESSVTHHWYVLFTHFEHFSLINVVFLVAMAESILEAPEPDG